jgi:hypothetical protein
MANLENDQTVPMFMNDADLEGRGFTALIKRDANLCFCLWSLLGNLR